MKDFTDLLEGYLSSSNNMIETEATFNRFLVDTLGKFLWISQITYGEEIEKVFMNFLNLKDDFHRNNTSPEVKKKALIWTMVMAKWLNLKTLGMMIANFAQLLPFGSFKNDLTTKYKYFDKRECSSMSEEEKDLHGIFAKLSGIGNDTVKVSLFELPYLVGLPEARLSTSIPIRETAYFSHCSLIESGLKGSEEYLNFFTRFNCFAWWEDYIIGRYKIHPCDTTDQEKKNVCCIWPDVFGDNLLPIMAAMKQMRHRGMSMESITVCLALLVLGYHSLHFKCFFPEPSGSI